MSAVKDNDRKFREQTITNIDVIYVCHAVMICIACIIFPTIRTPVGRSTPQRTELSL